MAALADAPSSAALGERHAYASPNYQVLGLLVETLSGQSFGAYVQRHIFTPLGMTGSHTSPPKGTDASVMACGHRYWFGFPRQTTLPAEPGRLPAAALISSAEDMARYLSALLDAGRGKTRSLLSPRGFEQLFTGGAEGKSFAYAMGWRRGPIRGVPAIHHGGHLYHFRGKMILLPDHDRGVVVLTNASSMIGRTTSHVIANGVVALLADKRPAKSVISLKWALSGLALIMIILTLGLAKEAFTFRKWTEHALVQLGQSGRPKWKVWGSLAWGLIVPPALLIGLPLVLHQNWSQMIRGIPDLSWWMLIYLPGGFLLGLARIRAVTRGSKAGTVSREESR